MNTDPSNDVPPSLESDPGDGDTQRPHPDPDDIQPRVSEFDPMTRRALSEYGRWCPRDN